MTRTRLSHALGLCLVLVAGCGGGSTKGNLGDVLEVPATDVGQDSGGEDLWEEGVRDVPDGFEETLPGDLPAGDADVVLPDAEPDAEPDAPPVDVATDTPPPDSVEDVSADADGVEPEVIEASGSCATPIEVWGGKAVGPELPPGGLDYETRTGAVTSGSDPWCGPSGAQGEVVFRLVLGAPLYVILTALAQVPDYTPVVTFLKESCSGSLMECTAAEANGGTTEMATALPPGTWIAIVRLVPLQEGLPTEGVAVDASFEFEAGEICDNGEDDNADWDVDCDDPTCFWDPYCTGGHSGETCADPFLINNGAPVAPSQEFFEVGTLGGRIDDYQPGAACWPSVAGSSDAVWRIVLPAELTLEVAAAFYDGTNGQVYVMDPACSAVVSCLSPDVAGDPNLLVTLPAGTYHLVVDRGPDTPQSLAFDLYVFVDEP